MGIGGFAMEQSSCLPSGNLTISMAIFNSYVSLPEGSSYNMVRSIDRRFSIDEITSQKMVHYLLTCVFFSPCPDDKLDFL